MLSEYEKRELRAIEEMLLSDNRLSARFRRRRSRRTPRLPRILLVSGALIMVAAAFLGLGEVFVQGLALALAGLIWVLPWRRFPRWILRWPSDGSGA